MTRHAYSPPRINGVILFSTDIAPEDALRAARQPDPATMREYLLAPPEPPEIHYLSPLGGYPDGRENRRERRRRERATKKHR